MTGVVAGDNAAIVPGASVHNGVSTRGPTMG
jgi:hypothetical protein